MSDFKLSIVTINYNNAEGLKKTIESVLTQTDLPQEKFEYIIVDGASTDGSVDIIKEFDEKTMFPLKITSWTSEPDKGIYNAMNKGIKKTTGTLVGIMNSGDTFVKNAFASLEEIANKNPDTILYGTSNRITNGKYSGGYATSHEKLLETMLPHDACFVPISIYKKYGFYDESFKSSGDWELFIKFYLNNVPFLYINKIISNFATGGISESRLNLVKSENRRIARKYGLSFSQNKKRLMKFTVVFTLGFLVGFFCFFIVSKLF